LGGEAHWLIEDLEALRPGAPGVDSNRLTAEHVTQERAAHIFSSIALNIRDAAKAAVPFSADLRLLEKTPKNALRVPFLDRELAEFVAWNVPPHLKLKGFFRPTTKYIFRKAMHDVLPKEVLQQPKAGFAAPVDYWLAHDLKEMVDDLLSESRIRRRGLLRPEAVRAFVDEHRSGAQDWSMQIWQFLTLELWMQTFLDGGAKNFATEFDAPQAATA